MRTLKQIARESISVEDRMVMNDPEVIFRTEWGLKDLRIITTSTTGVPNELFFENSLFLF